jgi:hypothetical protein
MNFYSFLELEAIIKYIDSQNLIVLELISYLNNNLNGDFEVIYSKFEKKLKQPFLKLVVISLHTLGYVNIDGEKIETSRLFLEATKSDNYLLNIFTYKMNMENYVAKNNNYNSLEKKLPDFFIVFLKDYFDNIKNNRKL